MKRRITDRNIPALYVFRVAVLALAALLLWGCVSYPQLPVQYATMKLIERGTVTPEEVQERVSRVRGLVVDGITLSELGQRVRGAIGYTKLDPSDRLLVDAILGDIAHRLDVGFESPIDDAHKDAILEALDWIDQAAGYYR